MKGKFPVAIVVLCGVVALSVSPASAQLRAGVAAPAPAVTVRGAGSVLQMPATLSEATVMPPQNLDLAPAAPVFQPADALSDGQDDAVSGFQPSAGLSAEAFAVDTAGDRGAAVGEAEAAALDGASMDGARAAAASSLSPVRRVRPSSAWFKYSRGEAERVLKRLVAKGGQLEYRTGGGVLIGIGMADYGTLVKSGALTLYRKRVRDDDGQEHKVWDSIYILQASNRSPFAGARLDALVADGQAAAARINKELESFREVISSARVQPLDSPDVPRIKAQVERALPVMQKHIAAFEAGQKRWTARTAHLVGGLNPDQRAFAKAVLGAAAPAIEPIGIDIPTAETIVRIDKVLFGRPEILSVDPGYESIRIVVDANVLVASGGTMVGQAKRLKALLLANGVSAKVKIEVCNDVERATKLFLDTVLAPAVGRENIAGFATSGLDSDPAGWLELRVRPGADGAAKNLLPRFKETLARYGFKSFSRNVLVAVQNADGSVSGDEGMPVGDPFNTWIY